MTIKEALKEYHKIEIELLLAHVLKKPKEFLYLYPERSLSAYQLISLSALIKRRMWGEPIAYILGYKDFCGLRFKVNKNVLVPRPETEGLADLVFAKLRSTPPKIGGRGPQILQQNIGVPRGVAAVRQTGRYDHLLQIPTTSRRFAADSFYSRRRNSMVIPISPIKILDLGTGSGNIIISLAKKLNLWKSCTNVQVFHMFASDVSLAALKVAKQNAKTHGIKITFLKSDLLKGIKFNPDIIIANLPYLPAEALAKEGLSKEWVLESAGLKFEPRQALFTEDKGLYLIRQLLKQVADKKNKPKLVYLEFDPRQKPALTSAIKKHLPKAEVKFYKDFAGRWRCAEICI